MPIDPTIFKAYDIRGIYPGQFDEQTAHQVAQGFAQLLRQENPDKHLTVVVGRDMRVSSPALRDQVVAGLQQSGVDVVDVGLVSTPTFYFAVADRQYDGGLQVSASHNPKEYNGLKLVRSRGIPVGRDSGMADVQKNVEQQNFFTAPHPGTLTMGPDMTTRCAQVEGSGVDRSTIRPMTIVVDAANAMGALDIEAAFSGLPGQLVKLNFELDGTFPVHQPDPLEPENLRVLQQAVLAHKADLGIAPDGDGDRIFFVDEKGEVIRQEILRGIMAQIALREHPGATVCYDIRPGRITRDMIEQAGGRAVVTPVGHALIKSVMLREGAVFGGESSGHYFYQFPFGTFEAPMVLIWKFLQWVSNQSGTVSAMVAPYKKYFHSGEINSRVKDVPAVLQNIQQHYHDGKIDMLDGVSVEYPDFWFNVRGSNTEPLIRLNLEAISPEVMVQKRDEVLGIIRQ